MTIGRLSIGALGLCLGLMLGSTAPRANGETIRSAPRTAATLTRAKVAINKSTTVRVDMPFSDILIGQSEIAEVLPLSDRTLYILGKKPGTTNVSILDADRRLIGVIDVEVGVDANTIGQHISQEIGGGVRARSLGDKVVLSGVAADGPSLDRATTIAGSMVPAGPAGVINTARVASAQQVMLKVRFLEVNRQAGRDLGVQLGSKGSRGLITGGREGLFIADPRNPTGGQQIPLLQTAASAALGNSGVPFGSVLANIGGREGVDVFINALEQKGLLRRLAEPNLIALSGESADFLAGGEFPIPVASNSTAGFPTVTIAFKEFGVRLAFTPTVLGNGIINLKMKPEVSELDFTTAVSTGNGILIPAITTRRANTTVELRDGQSFAVAGLLQSRSNRRIDGVPWLMDVPVIGQLFRSNGFQENETELVVIVTPHIVKPARPGDKLHSPLETTVPANDSDFFALGKTEVERGRAGPVGHLVKTQGAALGAYGHIVEATPARPVIRKSKAVNPGPSEEPLRVKN